MEESSQAKQPESCPASLSCQWPISLMTHESYKKGDMLFKKGDKAEKMFYIKKGCIRLIEINKIIGQDQVIGEMGVFSPFKERTASALCEDDLEVYTMGRDEVLKFFSEDPAVAFNLMQISIKRFIENLQAETAARERIASELRIARNIQISMLPQDFPPFPDRKEFDIFAMMDPAREVGGDFYDFFFVDKDRLCMIIGDVSGKGVPAALFMAISKALLKTEALLGLPPDEILYRVNNILLPDNKTCMFVTLFCMILNTATGELAISNAGHNPPLICGDNRCFDFFSVPAGCVVGVMEDTKFICKKMILNPNDLVFLYTDGVTEAMNGQRKMFSEERLRLTLENLKDTHRDVQDIIKVMREEIREFADGEEQSDDITMLALRYHGKGV
jgi:phosphoserine phosphatase RsbU/P